MFLLDKTFTITLLINLKEKLKQNIFTEGEKKQIQKETNWINDYN